jgi:hypothetical protein
MQLFPLKCVILDNTCHTDLQQETVNKPAAPPPPHQGRGCEVRQTRCRGIGILTSATRGERQSLPPVIVPAAIAFYDQCRWQFSAFADVGTPWIIDYRRYRCGTCFGVA